MDPVESTEPIKVNKWDSNDVKNALDDAIHNIMTKTYNYIENYHLIDSRLLICTIAVAIALLGLLWDYLYPFPVSKNMLLFCSTSYFILMGVFTWFSMYIEKGTFLVVRHPNKARIYKFSSIQKKFDDMYSLSLEVYDENSKKKRSATKKWSVANFITEDGHVLNELVLSKIKKLHDSLSDDRKDK